MNAQVIETGGQTIFEMVNFDWYLSEYFGVLDTTVAWDPAIVNSPEPGSGPDPTGVNGYSGRFRSVIGGRDTATGADNGAFYFKDFSGTPLESITLVDFVVTDGFNVDVTSDFDILKIDGTANGGFGYYTNYKSQPSITPAATYDSFILVNKKHRVFLTSNGLANDFFITIKFQDDNNTSIPIPTKTFYFPGDNQIDETSLENLQTIHVGGEQLITPFVTWGQTSLPIEDFTLNTPNLPGCTTSFCPGLFYEYGYEEGLTLPVDLVKFYGMNGANKNTNGGISVAQPNQETLQWSIVFEQQPFTGDNDPSNTTPTIFEIITDASGQGVLREITPGVGFGLYALRILVQSNDGSLLPAYFDIKITIGRKTADGSFDNNVIDFDLYYDNSYVLSLHNTPTDAFDLLPGGQNTSILNTFPKIYPSIAGLAGQIAPGDLTGTFANTTNGGYSYGGSVPAQFQRLNVMQTSPAGPSSEGALTQGTGYINIEMLIKGVETGPYENTFQTSQVSWAVEYREITPSVGDWKPATDIEGNVLSWNNLLTGSTTPETNPQQSGKRLDGDVPTAGGGRFSTSTHSSAHSTPNSQSETEQIYGAGYDEQPLGDPPYTNDNPANFVQYRAQFKKSVSSPSTPEIYLGRWVVVGKSHIYGDITAPPCFGEYRVIIQNIGGECDTCQSQIVGTLPGQISPNPYSLARQLAGNMKVGDFYYDLKPPDSPRSYAYIVDTTVRGTQAIALNVDMNQNTNPNIVTMYAEEGVNRYVSQFYADAGLTELVTSTSPTYQWSSGSVGFVSYTAAASTDANSNVPYSVLQPTPPGQSLDKRIGPALAAENSAVKGGDDESEQWQRLWACEITPTTGLKIPKSSVGRSTQS